MSDMFLNLDLNVLPVQYGVTAGSLIERFFQHVMTFAVEAAAIDNEPPKSFENPESDNQICLIEVQGDADIIYRYHHAADSRIAHRPDRSTGWVNDRTSDSESQKDAIEILQKETTERAIILRIRSKISSDVFFVATTSEMFMTTVLFSQAPA